MWCKPVRGRKSKQQKRKIFIYLRVRRWGLWKVTWQAGKAPQTYAEDTASNSSPLRLFKTGFNNALTVMENVDRSSKVPVTDAISRYPSILQKVAYTVTALPSTQVSVERLYSALHIIRSDLRTSMKEDLLEAILFLRMNGCGKLCV